MPSKTKTGLWPRVVLGAASMASGGALLAYFLTGTPLHIALAATVGLGVGAWVVVWRALPAAARKALAQRARIGLLVGLCATAAYDVSRWLLVETTGSTVRPFDAWPLFGELLGAGDRTTTSALVVGFAFHLVNGLGFAVGYTIVLAEKGVIAGIIWALVLETVMVSFYPGWLGLKALDEFISVTVFGHFAYGAVLGWLARALVRRSREREPAWKG
ncbi:DUF6789 family protein [Allorhizocola rhizosphaerae]|uniref:DUF6789 family protein n=1 Tax=Allorhizocola rhizosphaerae TaxID=1872709 RepID=UPI0013C33056|nr:DUF6789 family protein [Allorhizocola rhizosphaerae]